MSNIEGYEIQPDAKIDNAEPFVIAGSKDIIVPKELDDRLSIGINKLRHKGKLLKAITYLGAAAIFLIISVSIITINPTFRSYAVKLPIVSTFINSFYRDESIEHAKKNGFIKMNNIVKEKDGLRFEIGELYYDGLRLAMDTKIYGDKLNEYLKQEYQEILQLDCIINTEGHESRIGSTMIELFKVREGDNNYVYTRTEQVFTESELNYILNNNKQLDVELSFRAKNFSSQFIIPVTLDSFNGIKKEDSNSEYAFDSSFPIRSINIEKIISSPTLSQMYYKVDTEENTDFLCFQNSYITDTEGKKYNGEQKLDKFLTLPDENYIKEGKDEFKKLSGLAYNVNIFSDSKFMLNITPSFYSVNSKPQKFCFEGIHIKQRKNFTLDLKADFPQYLFFNNKEIKILSADYKDGELFIKLDRDWSIPDIKQINVVSINYGDNQMTQAIDYSNFAIGTNKTDNEGNKIALEKKDKYFVTVEAEFVIDKKVEIPFKK